MSPKACTPAGSPRLGADHPGTLASVEADQLLNALISEGLPLLPQGGVGPLTAVPIEVGHAKTPYLEVGCWSTWRLFRMLAASTRSLPESTSSVAHADRVHARLGALLASGSQFAQLPPREAGTAPPVQIYRERSRPHLELGPTDLATAAR